MKRYISAIVMFSVMAVSVQLFAGTAAAQRNDNYNYDQYDQQYDYGQPSVYDRHRKAINITIATGAGAIIGALLGGKKGALIGAGAGAATGYVITKKQHPRNPNNVYYYNYNY